MNKYWKGLQIKTSMTVQGEKLTGNYLVKWYHRLMNTATAQANPNIALAMVSQGNTVYDDYKAGFAWCEDMVQKQP